MPLSIGTPTTVIGTAGDPTVARPASSNGDLLIGHIAMDWGAYSEIDQPIGDNWILIPELSHDGGGTTGPQRKTFYKIVNNEFADYTWTATGGNTVSVHITPISGIGPTPVLVGAKAQNTTETCPSVTPTSTADLLLCWSVIDGNGGGPAVWTPPSGMTEQFELDSAGNMTLSQAYLLSVGTTPSGTKDFTMSGVPYRNGAASGTHFTLAINEGAPFVQAEGTKNASAMRAMTRGRF